MSSVVNVKNYTDDQIIKRVESLPTFKGWKKGKYDIWIRSNEDAFNRFDDKGYSFEVLKDGEKPAFKMVCTGTTNPGSQGLKNFEQYGNKRCAVLLGDYMVYESHSYGLHRGKYAAYRQSKPFPYVWDDNKNEISGDSDKIIYDEVIYANLHAAGEHSEHINGNSIACIVRNVKEQYNKWMTWMNKDKYVTLCILKEW